MSNNIVSEGLGNNLGLCDKHILLISPEPWSHIFVSKHHYAIELAKRGNKVFFLNPPDANIETPIQFSTSEAGPDITIVDYRGQLKGLRFFPAFIRVLMNKRFLSQLERKAGCRMDVIWNFENSRFYDLQFAGERLKIYHQVDLNQDFHVMQAVSSADICFCTTDFILKKLQDFNKRVFKIHHGVSDDALQYTSNITASKLHNSRATATIIGNLDGAYLDLDLLQKVVKANDDVSFVMVGNFDYNKATFKGLHKFPNVQFTGQVASNTIGEYLAKSDCLLVCYKADEFKEQLASPHKIMEYLASGKVSIATYTDEYKDKSCLLEMSKDNCEYVDLFSKVVKNLAYYNSPTKRNIRVKFAADHSYFRQLDRIFKLIEENVPGSLSVGFVLQQ